MIVLFKMPLFSLKVKSVTAITNQVGEKKMVFLFTKMVTEGEMVINWFKIIFSLLFDYLLFYLP